MTAVRPSLLNEGNVRKYVRAPRTGAMRGGRRSLLIVGVVVGLVVGGVVCRARRGFCLGLGLRAGWGEWALALAGWPLAGYPRTERLIMQFDNQT